MPPPERQIGTKKCRKNESWACSPDQVTLETRENVGDARGEVLCLRKLPKFSDLWQQEQVSTHFQEPGFPKGGKGKQKRSDIIQGGNIVHS